MILGGLFMDLLFNEQDLIDSVCVYTAVKEAANLESINADITFNPSFGFTAKANVPGRIRNLDEQELIAAISIYLNRYHNFNPDLLFVDLQFSKADGVTASIQVKYE